MSDKVFGGQFKRPNRHRLIAYVHHLGNTGQWSGRHELRNWSNVTFHKSCAGAGEMGAGGGDDDWHLVGAALTRLGVTGSAATYVSKWSETNRQLFRQVLDEARSIR